jgi:asparagine N-glycosylation enzyme membrane subunit Stt3
MSPRPGLRLLPWLPVLGIMTLWLAVLTHGSWSGPMEGWLPGTDAYMRLERVRRLMDGAGWFDGTVPRSNMPFGEDLHWSRPFDVVIVLATLLARPFTDDPLLMAAAVLPPVLLVAASVATAWMVRPLLPGLATPLAALFPLGQPVFLGYGMPGRADHHIFIVLLTVLLFGAVVRLLQDRSRAEAWSSIGSTRARNTAFWGGIAAGGLLWVSVEGLLPLALATLVLALPWLGEDPDRWRDINLRFHGAATLVMAAAVMLERTPAGWLAVHLDRVSTIHVVLGLGMTVFWLILAPLVRARGTRTRVGLAGIGALAVALAIAAIDVRFFLGPFASLDPGLVDAWLPQIREVSPPRGFARAAYYAGAPVVALLLTPALFRTGAGDRASRVPLALVVAATLALGLSQVRWLMYAEVFAVALLAVAISDAALALRGSRLRAWTRGALSVLAFAGWTVVGGVLLGAEEPVGERCTDADAVHAVRDLAPAVVATHVDLGPALVFHTRHSVVAAPYLRNSGSRAVVDALNSSDPSAARRILEARSTELVVVCTHPRDPYLVEERDGAGTLYGALVRGVPPSWLDAVVAGDSATVRVYRVR